MAASETRSISSASSDATIQRALSEQPEYVVDTNSWGYLTSFTEGISSYAFDKAQRTYYISGPRNGEREPVDIVLPGTGSLYCLIEWDGNENAKESAVRFMDRSDDSSAVIHVNRTRIGRGRACLLRHGDHVVFGTKTSKEGTEGGGWPSEYYFEFRNTLRNSPAKGVHKHYDMLHELGRGSFSTVMKALSKKEGLWYAVKIIPVHHLNLPVGWEKTIVSDKRSTNPIVQRLLRECMILKDLRHKNICRLRQVFPESQQISLVLELVEGGDLLKYLLQNKKAMTEIQAGHIVYQICDALAYTHRWNIAHRDLKLENILLTVDDPPIVKVADFGLAKIVSTYSSLHSWCGTGYYLAPEVLEGHGRQPYTQVVDSWSVGIITFILLSFERQPYVQVAADTGSTTARVTRRVNWQLLQRHGISAQCNDFLRGLLEHNPLRRTTMEDAFRNRWLFSQAMARMIRPTLENPFYEPFPERSITAPSPDRRPFRAVRSAPASQSIRWAQERTEDWAVTQEPHLPGVSLATMSLPIGNDIDRVRPTTYRPHKRKVQDGSGFSLGRIAERRTSGNTDVVATSFPKIVSEPPIPSAVWWRTATPSPTAKKPHTFGGADTTSLITYDYDDVPPRVLPQMFSSAVPTSIPESSGGFGLMRTRNSSHHHRLTYSPFARRV